jgi:NAD-dependent dihydropyrimidine dehydrogenase PreA subunit
LAYVITERCIGTKDASCVEVCPVDCIHTSDIAEQYYINPADCIDCGACIDPCPVDAIYPAEEVPDQLRSFIGVNRAFFQ